MCEIGLFTQIFFTSTKTSRMVSLTFGVVRLGPVVLFLSHLYLFQANFTSNFGTNILFRLLLCLELTEKGRFRMG
jgi:hypothetical protein